MIPQDHPQVPDRNFWLNGRSWSQGQEACTTKQSWSRCGPVDHSLKMDLQASRLFQSEPKGVVSPSQTTVLTCGYLPPPRPCYSWNSRWLQAYGLERGGEWRRSLYESSGCLESDTVKVYVKTSQFLISLCLSLEGWRMRHITGLLDRLSLHN